MYSKEDYLKDNYGVCSLGGDCSCLKPQNPWLGRACPYWNPIIGTEIDPEFAEELKKQFGVE